MLYIHIQLCLHLYTNMYNSVHTIVVVHYVYIIEKRKGNLGREKETDFQGSGVYSARAVHRNFPVVLNERTHRWCACTQGAPFQPIFTHTCRQPVPLTTAVILNHTHMYTKHASRIVANTHTHTHTCRALLYYVHGLGCVSTSLPQPLPLKLGALLARALRSPKHILLFF